jgi:hypothetical protein
LQLTFVVAVNDRRILNSNLLASPCLQGEHGHQVLLQEGYASAALAYNAALAFAKNEIVVFLHQDVFLPDNWMSDLVRSLHILQSSDSNWGLIGCCGIANDRTRIGYLYTPGEGIIGAPFANPTPVRVLDEVVLAVRESSGLTFSEDLPSFHFYGPDICLTAAERRMNCYAISAFCIHNSRQYFEFPREFYACYRYMKRKWRKSLPLQTSCICVSRFDWDLWKRRVKKIISIASGRTLDRGTRVEDPRMLVKHIRAEGGV